MSGSIIFAGGGSGGHISPGLAVAERLHALAPDAGVHFLCSTRAIDRSMLEAAGAPFSPLTAEPMRRSPGGLLRFARAMIEGTRQAKVVLRAEEPRAILALGGFVSAPVVRAARALDIAVVLLNLDAIPGRANQWVARRASAVRSAVAMNDPKALGDCVEVGFPLRRSAIAPADPLSCRERLGLEPNRPTLLVTGASQGAATLNRLLLDFLQDRAGVLAEWQVLHLSGPSDCACLKSAYDRAGVPAIVEPFLSQMGLAWGAADLALSRAGANSVAEARANHVPTLFVPYPWHRDLHQRFNAAPSVRAGEAALALDAIDPVANMHAIGGPLAELLLDPARRGGMRRALEAAPSSDGAQDLASELLAFSS